MLLGIYGVFAVGKTTFLSDNMDDFAEAVDGKYNLSVVLADLATMYEFDNTVWNVYKSKTLWKNTQVAKSDYLREMVCNRERLWIVESARYFGGMHEMLVSTFQEANGGLMYIVPYTDGSTGKQFIIDRCKKRNKAFNEKYWDDKRLEYECYGRYMNAMDNVYRPAGVKYYKFHVGYERTEWGTIRQTIFKLLSLDKERWYKK